MRESATTGQFVNAEGLTTWYEEYGSGYPLVMLHGDILNAEAFSRQIPSFSMKYKVIIPERRGHGRTEDLPDDYTYDLFVNDTSAFIDALGLKQVNLLGHSGGANVALRIAASRHDIVTRLVAISGQSSIQLTGERKKQMLSWPADDFRRRVPGVAESYERVTPDGVKRFPQFFEKIKKMWATDWKIHDAELESISAPTLILLGDHDLGSVEDAAALSRKIPNAQLCVIPGAGHMLMSQKAGTINNIVLDFLAGT